MGRLWSVRGAVGRSGCCTSVLYRDVSYPPRVLLGYARAGTSEDLQRQVLVLQQAGVRVDNIYADLAPSRGERGRGDVIVPETLAPLGLTIRETLGLVR
jgi:hypothetical protein